MPFFRSIPPRPRQILRPLLICHRLSEKEGDLPHKKNIFFFLETCREEYGCLEVGAAEVFFGCGPQNFPFLPPFLRLTAGVTSPKIKNSPDRWWSLLCWLLVIPCKSEMRKIIHSPISLMAIRTHWIAVGKCMSHKGLLMSTGKIHAISRGHLGKNRIIRFNRCTGPKGLGLGMGQF